MILKTKEKFTPYLTIVLITSLFCFSAIGQINLNKQNWIHGALNCKKNIDAPIQVVQYDQNTWILRQNKCTNYEAPFIFLFLGQEKALLMDTGATKKKKSFPLYKTVNAIVENWQ